MNRNQNDKQIIFVSRIQAAISAEYLYNQCFNYKGRILLIEQGRMINTKKTE